MNAAEWKARMERRSTVVMRVATASFLLSLLAMHCFGPMAGLIPALGYVVFTVLY